VSRSRGLLAGLFTLTGVLHFLAPRRYEAIMPPYIPRHREAVLLSGGAEIAGALAVVPEATRPFARWWLLGLLVAVFPANLHMALRPDDVRGLAGVPRWLLWARLPMQPLIGLWVWRATSE